jgi:hypothetical protein
MRITAHQPLFLPWLGFFEKIMYADTYVVLDNVQFSRRDYMHRNRIEINQESRWITIPIESDSARKEIREVLVEGQNWKRVHLESIRRSYSKTPFFDDIFSILQAAYYSTDSKYLFDYSMPLLTELFNYLGIRTEIKLLSETDIKSRKSQLILELCLQAECNEYLAGSQGLEYLDVKAFRDNRVDVLNQEYKHPRYKQRFDEFIPNLSVIDLICYQGQKAPFVIEQGRWYNRN